MIIIVLPVSLYAIYAMMFLGLIGQGFIGNGINEAVFAFMSIFMACIGAITFSVLYKVYEEKGVEEKLISPIVFAVINGLIAFIGTAYVFFENYMSFSKDTLFMIITLYSAIIIINSILCVIKAHTKNSRWTAIISVLLIVITIIFSIRFNVSVKNQKANKGNDVSCLSHYCQLTDA